MKKLEILLSIIKNKFINRLDVKHNLKLFFVFFGLFFSMLSFMFGFSQPVMAAGFDCSKASTWVEKTICDDSELSTLDDKMTQTYKAELASADGNTGYIKSVQKDWLKYQRNTCNTKDCLTREYKEWLSGKYTYGTHWDYAKELNKHQLPTSFAFGEFNDEVAVDVFNNGETGYETIHSVNSIVIHQVPTKPYIAIIDGDLVFHNAHICTLDDEKALWSENHWLISNYHDLDDGVCELRLYPNGKGSLFLQDIDNQCRKLHCGMRGHFDGIEMSK